MELIKTENKETRAGDRAFSVTTSLKLINSCWLKKIYILLLSDQSGQDNMYFCEFR